MMVPLSDGLPIVRGQRRTRAVVQPADGKLPYTPAAPEGDDGRAAAGSPLDNPETAAQRRALPGRRRASRRCRRFALRQPAADRPDPRPGGDPHRIRRRGAHRADHRHARAEGRLGRMGNSIGHWEGETLVIETIGLPDADRLRIVPHLIVPGAAKVIERLTPISDRELLYQFTVVDPKTYTAPWLGEFSWYRTDKPMYEHACHEGNYSLPNILAGARHDEAVAKAAATPSLP